MFLLNPFNLSVISSISIVALTHDRAGLYPGKRMPSISAVESGGSRACNGAPALCDRRYSNVTFLGTHDSPFVGQLPTQNQNLNVQDQLDAGVRYLQGQTHMFLGAPHFCHTSCMQLDVGEVSRWLSEVKGFLDGNPNEVVTLLLTNPDGIDMSTFDGVFKSVGADKYAYTPPANPMQLSDWPTLGEMIDSNRRLVVFIDYGADQNRVPYLLGEFSHYWEDAFDQTSDSFTDCSVDRPNKVHGDGYSTAPKTNNAASIITQGNNCAARWGKYPNVILVDYFDKGNPMDAAKRMNGL